MEETEEPEQEKGEKQEINLQQTSKFINKVMFLFFGIAALLGWNALLTQMDYFDYFLEDMNPTKTFPFLNFILNISFQFLLLWKKDLIPLNIELIVGIIGSIVMLVLIPLSASLLGINEKINMTITGGLVVIMGFVNALASGGFFSYAGHFPLEMIVIFTVGQGFSAIIMNILQYIVLVAVNIDDYEKQLIIRGWIFFSIAIIILIICLILFLLSYKDEYCIYYLNKAGNTFLSKKDKESKVISLLSDEERISDAKEDEIKKDQIQNIDEEEMIEERFTPKFSYIFKKIWDLDLLACYGYVLTFSLFPYASASQKIFDIKEYNFVTIITIYNVFDTFGRYIVKIMSPNKKVNMIIVLGRSILLFTIIFNCYCQVNYDINIAYTSIILIINTAILGVTNGIGATLTFGLASNSVEDEIKKQTGGSIGFFSILGIFLGSCAAFGTGAIIDSILGK